MVKGGTKRKATMERITKRESAATTFTKRSYGLHSKVSQLCLLTDAQIAVLATPPSSHSNVSFFSFGHSSVDSIVTAFLTGERPAVREEIDDHEDLGICLARKELGLPQWWDDDALLKSKNPQELSLAINSMSRLLTKINELRAEDAEEEPPLKKQKKKKNEETMKKTEPTVEQTLVLPSGSSDRTLDYNNNNNDSLEEIDFDQLIDLDLDLDFDFESMNSSDNNDETMKMTEPLDQPLLLPYDICASPDNNNTYSTGEMSLDYGIDKQLQETTIAMSSVACDDGVSALNEDDINFSDYLTQFLQS
ncbi:unnamed protein product [Brassica rapa]|uniref:MADS-box domain-containing protein n=2 Tax=Brassica TaxID=3705 RepID=A0A3P6BYQ0_BRACM|nr:unnamed protein product [Brassica rapa]VDD11447.1 unnamed protein product [Brassica rapa]